MYFVSHPLLSQVHKLVLRCSLPTDGSGLEKEGMNGVLPDVIRPENQAIQLMVRKENNQHTMFTVRDILTVRQLIFYCGIALAVAVAVLLTGILIRVFNDCGENRRIITSPPTGNDHYVAYRCTSLYCALLHCASQVLSFFLVLCFYLTQNSL